MTSSSSPRNINSAKPFRRAAEAYRVRGWLGTLPLPPQAKKKPPEGYTGRTADYPDDETIEEWLRDPRFAQGNICLHLGPVEIDEGARADWPEDLEIIGIDVDDYTEAGKIKAGASQLAALEAELGPLPPTWLSSSRSGPSGIRFYLVPAGYAWAGKADKHIDIIQKCHRYAIVWPSWHPEGGQYTWRRSDDPKDHVHNIDDLPEVSELPMLPSAWIERLTRGGMRASDRDGDIDMDLSVDEMFRWAVGNLPGSGDDDNMCSKMSAAVDYWINQIDEDASTHDKIVESHWNIVCLASEGHLGWRKACVAVERYIANDTVKTRGKRGITELGQEIGRSKINALRKLKAQIDSGKRRLVASCPCYEPSDDEMEQFNAAMSQRISESRKVKASNKSASAGGNDESKAEGGDRRFDGDAPRRSRSDGMGNSGNGEGSVENGSDGSDESFNESSLGGRDGYWPSGIPDGKAKDPGEYEFNDRGNGQHWADMHRNSAFYVPALNNWIMWTGRSWIVGDGCAERSYERIERRQGRYAQQLTRRALELKAQQDPGADAAVGQAKRWRAWAERSGNVGPIESALKSAQSRLHIEESELNSHPHLLGCENGVIELDFTTKVNDKGVAIDGSHPSLLKLREIRKDDLITLTTGCNYMPWEDVVSGEFGGDTVDRAAVWLGALEQILPDREVRRYVQKLVGYSLFGDNTERVIVFMHGGTGTGKTTFLNAILGALGQYGDSVDLNIFRGDRQTNPGLAYALPRRFISASEMTSKSVVHGDVFKRITGGDEIVAELKYSNEAIRRRPAFTPWIATNTPPNIPTADAAINARLIVVPFNSAIKFKDAWMNSRLSGSKAMSSVVLSWIVEGWAMYRREGIRIENAPTAVRKETELFSVELSDVSSFMKDFLQFARDDKEAWSAFSKTKKRIVDWPSEWRVEVNEMFGEYERWCSENRVHERDVLTPRKLNRALRDYGVQSGKVHVRDATPPVQTFYGGVRLVGPDAKVFQLHVQKDSDS